MWQKTFQVRLPADRVAPAELIATWKQRFPGFWPEGNAFYGSLTGIAAGGNRAPQQVDTQVVCVDKKRQWSRWRNVWHSSAIRSTLYMLGAPLRGRGACSP